MDPLSDEQIKEVANTLTSKQAAKEIMNNFLPLLQSKLSSNVHLKNRPIDLTSKALVPSDFKESLPLDTIGLIRILGRPRSSVRKYVKTRLMRGKIKPVSGRLWVRFPSGTQNFSLSHARVM